MILYALLLLLTIIACIFSNGNRSKEVVSSVLILIIMMLMVAFRDKMCGTDTLHYLRAYNGNNISNERFEPLFLMLKDISPSFYFLTGIIAIATYAILIKVIVSEVRLCTFAVLIFLISRSLFFQESFNIIRQSLAASFLLLAFVQQFHGKRIWAVMSIAIATGFHYSSLLGLPCLFLRNLKISRIICISTIVVSFLLGASGTLIQSISQNIVELSDLGMGEQIDHYSLYGNMTDNLSNFRGLFSKTFPISLFAIVCYPSTEQKWKEYGYYYNIFLFATIIGNIIIPSLQWGFRLVFSLQIIQVLVIPKCFEFSSGKTKKQLLLVVVYSCLLYLYHMYNLPNNGIRPIIPYKSYLEIF